MNPKQEPESKSSVLLIISPNFLMHNSFRNLLNCRLQKFDEDAGKLQVNCIIYLLSTYFTTEVGADLEVHSFAKG